MVLETKNARIECRILSQKILQTKAKAGKFVKNINSSNFSKSKAMNKD